MADFLKKIIKKIQEIGNDAEDKFPEINTSPEIKMSSGGSNKKKGVKANQSPVKTDSKVFVETDNDFAVSSEGIKGIIGSIIKPEERTIKNFFSPSFWLQKNEQFREVREKEKQDLNVFAILSDGARPTREYYVLTVLSCIIATVGLLQGSTAVIIGAMIVAPLMTPILAMSLFVIWGDVFLLRISVISILKGIFLSIAISSAIAFIIPMGSYSSEILSRTHPSLFDIMVALASGIIGAYGYANKKISNSLVGIAIAVALMPPLCTIGIGLGTMNIEIARGASILFLINLISIGLAGAVIFWLMRIHPITADHGAVKRRALYQIVISFILLTGIAVPIGLYMYEGYRVEIAEKNIKKTFESKMEQFTVYDIRRTGSHGKYILTITLSGINEPELEKVKQTIDKLMMENPVVRHIQVNFIKTINPYNASISGLNL